MKCVLYIVIAALLAFGVWHIMSKSKETVVVTNFEECVAAGNPVMESHPRQCVHEDEHFVEEIDDAMEVKGVASSYEECETMGGSINFSDPPQCTIDGQTFTKGEEPKETMEEPVVTNFEECVAATGTIQKSFPAQCVYNGETFVDTSEQPAPASDDLSVQ